jgi:hypothetical protein
VTGFVGVRFRYLDRQARAILRPGKYSDGRIGNYATLGFYHAGRRMRGSTLTAVFWEFTDLIVSWITA